MSALLAVVAPKFSTATSYESGVFVRLGSASQLLALSGKSVP
jgi:hypothetical protein